MSGLNMLDLFSGIGGFHEGFKRAGYQFDWVGFSEIDKYASAVYKYNYKESEELGDVKSIRSANLPKVDIITFGSPCQDFSIAGKRAGATKGTRSSLIWEAIRLITECKPRVFIWENVKGTFSSNDGADFWAIIQAFTNIGSYRLEWQLLNTRWFLPQNRERIYIVGYIGNRGGSKVFPIRYSDKIFAKSRRKRSITNQLATTITQNLKRGVHSGGETLIQVGNVDQKGHNSLWGRVYDANGISTTLTDGGGLGAKTGLYNINNKIRRLTPVECNRLQGFSDDHNKFGIIDGKLVEMSDAQRYKQAGNAVTVDVVQAVATIIKEKELL